MTMSKKFAARIGGQWLVLLAWGSGIGMFALLTIEDALHILHPAAILFLILLILTLLTPLVMAVGRFMRSFRGDRMPPSRWWTAAAFGPFALCAIWGGYAYECNSGRDVPKNLPMRLIIVAAASVSEARAVYLSPHRIETERLVMFYDDRVSSPLRDVALMDRHLAQMEQLTGLRLKTKIFYVRGGIYGDRHVSFLGLAFGSAQSPADYVDRHELAHALIGQSQTSASDPPTLLAEGWAESQSRDPGDLAAQAVQQRQMIDECARSWNSMTQEQREQFGRRFFDAEHMLHLAELAAANGGSVPSWLQELTGPRWYHHDAGAVYPIGGALTYYLIRRYGAAKFVEFYFAARPASIDRECRRIFGIDLKSIEPDFWQAQEELNNGQIRTSEKDEGSKLHSYR